MEIIEEQYRKVIEAYPNTIIINDFISHLKIPIINDAFLEINFTKYPKKPKVIYYKSNIPAYKKLDTKISSLMNWKKKNAISILELIHEILVFIKALISNIKTIKKDLINGTLALCRNQHPREIIGLLRVEKDIITEYVLPPGAITSNNSGIYFPGRLPLDPSIKGTIHSHPTGNPNPSLTDLKSIFMTRSFHIIVAYPYNNMNCVKCFDRKGKAIQLNIIE